MDDLSLFYTSSFTHGRVGFLLVGGLDKRWLEAETINHPYSGIPKEPYSVFRYSEGAVFRIPVFRRSRIPYSGIPKEPVVANHYNPSNRKFRD
jgi:hypothetical protein